VPRKLVNPDRHRRRRLANDRVIAKEVAALAGVSRSAVSWKTADKVLAATEQPSYRPTVLAGSLKSDHRSGRRYSERLLLPRNG
jgi:hypothetical protein